MYDDILRVLKSVRPDIDFETAKGLLSNNILDSYDVICILAELTERYNLEIDFDEVNESHFDDINAITNLVEKKVNIY